MSTQTQMQSFSTRAIPQGMRFDYWMSVLSESLWQVTDWSRVADNFNVDVQGAALGCLYSVREHISPHQARRTGIDVNRSRERSYHLFVSFEAPWACTHRRRDETMAAGDVLLMADDEHETRVPFGFDGVILRCPETWVESWLPDPGVLVGRCISHASRWGKVLSPIIMQLNPALATAPPLPPQLLVDQLGTMLALTAGEAEARIARDLLVKIRDCIRQRCQEPGLTAADVAASLQLPTRELHRVFTAAKLSFAAALMDARMDLALSMLSSRSLRRLSVGDIARRAGFSTVPHFSRVVRKRTGHTPLELRQTID